MHPDCRDETGSRRSSQCDPDTETNDTSHVKSVAKMTDGGNSEYSKCSGVGKCYITATVETRRT